MSIEISSVMMILTVFIHFVTFVGIFTKLERRLTALEISLIESQKILKTITDNLINVGLVDRRGEK
jgi:hypothetical protein